MDFWKKLQIMLLVLFCLAAGWAFVAGSAGNVTPAANNTVAPSTSSSGSVKFNFN